MLIDNAFLMAGLACLIAAIVGGGLNAFGIEIPVLEPVLHQIALGILGLILLAVAFELASFPRRIALGILGVLGLVLITVVGHNQGALEQKRCEKREEQRLAQEGVRAVDLSGPAAPSPCPVGVHLDLRSTPDRADLFLDWVPKGRTPVRLEGRTIAGLLVVMKDGYQPQFRHIHYAQSASLPEIILVPEPPRLRTRFLLLAAEGASGEAMAALVTRLGQEGFTTIGDPEVQEFQQALRQAGGLSHPALRAWAWAKFHTDLLVTARVRQSTREINKQDFGGPGIREVLHGVEQAEVYIALEVHDMRSGDHVTVVTGKGEAFTLDRGQSVQKALSEAVTEIVQKLRWWAHG
jgi:hypothetical protein